MNAIQRLFTQILPPAWADHMEVESRTWYVKCPCGYEQSVWELGGIRWKAAGTKKQYGYCSACGQKTWQTVYRKQAV